MKKRILAVLAAVCILITLFPTVAFAGELKQDFVILYSSNLRGDVDAYAKIKAVKNAYEAAGEDVILVDTGNFLQGTAYANTNRGLDIYNLMDATGYTAVAMGLAEFSYTDATTGYLYHGNFKRYYTQAELQNGAEELTYNQSKALTATREAKSFAQFTTVASNVKQSSNAYSYETTYKIAYNDNYVAIYGLTDPEVINSIQDGYLSEISAPSKPEGLTGDLVICLSNAGVSGEEFGDIVIDGSDGKEEVGVYKITKDKEITHEVIDLSTVTPDSDIQAMADEVKAKADTVVGKSDVILNGADSSNRNSETNLGDLTTDALVWYAENYIEGIDEGMKIVAVQNGGNCDNFIYTGDVTETDLLRALPFSPMGVGVIYVTGAQLLRTIEASVQCEDCPGFAQVSGLTYTVNTDNEYDKGEAYGKFFKANSDNRVVITSVNGVPFNKNETYALVCDNFLINGNDTYYTLNAAKENGAKYINDNMTNGNKVRQIVALYIQNVLGGTIGEEYAEAQGRIKTTTYTSYPDVPENEWYTEAVKYATQHGYFSGYSDGTFGPANNIIRQDFAVVMARAAGADLTNQSTDNLKFNDVDKNAYYAKALAWCVENGIISGYQNGNFGPADAITREQICAMIYRYQVKQGCMDDYSDETVNEVLAKYPDKLNVSDWALGSVAWCISNGVITGANGGTEIQSGANANRAQIAAIFTNLSRNELI